MKGSQAASDWFKTSFAEFESSKNKRKRSSQKATEVLTGTIAESWATKHTPENKDELAVHKKKVEEVSQWLQHVLGHQQHKASFLSLSGPSGAGKTACMEVLKKEVQFEIKPWANPIQKQYYDDVWQDFKPTGGASYESQQSTFSDFLLRANHYNSLQIFDDGHENIGRVYKRRGRCPLVLIFSDNVKGESAERNLLPVHVQRELGVHTIHFNPISNTSAMKVLQRIASEESKQDRKQFALPSKSDLEDLVESSGGDIRSAINALQFLCLREVASKKQASSTGSNRKRLKLSSKKKTSKPCEETQPIGSRDTSLFLFRALGKILHCKRESPDLREQSFLPPQLPPHLKEHERDLLTMDPENVIERSHLSADLLTAYLHQNYLAFYSSVEDIEMASQMLSHVDLVASNWKGRDVLSCNAGSVAARSILFCNRARAHANSSTGNGWRPLSKPATFAVHRTVRERHEQASFLFKATGLSSGCLHCDYIPYLGLNGSAPKNARVLVNELCHFASSSSRFQEPLGEKDVDAAKDDVTVSNFSVPDVEETIVQEEQDEENDDDYVIEDFDD